MTLKQWHDNGWLKPHKTSRQEIQGLLAMVHRDLRDASQKEVSADWRFGIAYNAALKLCTVLLYAEGYRAERDLAHYRTLQALPLILGAKHKGNADYLDRCRSKRNTVEYDIVGGATEADAEELIEFVKELEPEVLAWLKSRQPELSPS